MAVPLSLSVALDDVLLYFPRRLAILLLAFSFIAFIFCRRYRSHPKSLPPTPPLPETPFSLIRTTGLHTRPSIPPNHSCIHISRLMAYTHNTILRGLNAIYHHAPSITPSTPDASAFLLYCRTVCSFLQLHHETEEEFFFPAIEQAAGVPGLMEGNVRQHQAFEAQVQKLSEYAARTSAEAFRPEEIREIIEDMVEPLGRHLHEEIPSLLDLWDTVDSKSLSKAYRVMHDAAEKRSDPFRIAPFVLGCQDSSFLLDGRKTRFPEAPFIAPYIVDLVLSRRHRSAWRFNPSTMFGEPKGLAAAEKS